MTGHAPLDRWLRETGGQGPRPETLEQHLRGCAECRRALAQRTALAALFDQDDAAAELDAGAMRFELQAAARTSPRPVPVAPKVRGAYWRIGWSAAAAVLLCAAGAWWWTAQSRGVSSASVAPSEQTAPKSAGALARTADPGPHAVADPGIVVPDVGQPHIVRMREGHAEFEVEPRRRGEHFEVRVGDERVVVHGTRFEVTARDGRLLAVSVSEGVVALHLEPEEVLRLSAGEAWSRPETARPARGERPPGEHGSDSSEAESRVVPTAQPTRRVRPTDSRMNPATVDDAFAEAWRLARAGRHDAASFAFDALEDRPDLGARRADVLYWSAQSHARAGRSDIARTRLEHLVRAYPNAWHTERARAQLQSFEE